MSCEPFENAVKDAESAMDEACQNLEKSIGLYRNSVRVLCTALQLLSDHKVKFTSLTAECQSQVTNALDAIDSLRITVANSAQSCINTLLDATCEVDSNPPVVEEVAVEEPVKATKKKTSKTTEEPSTEEAGQ